MRRLTLLLAGSLLAVLGLVPPAHAAEAYVTKAEFKSVKKHMKLTRVHRIFDTKGKQSFYYDAIDAGMCADGDLWACATQVRDYRTKSRWGSASVTYDKRGGVWKVDSKTVYWG